MRSPVDLAEVFLAEVVMGWLQADPVFKPCVVMQSLSEPYEHATA